MPKPILLKGKGLTIEELIDISEHHHPVDLPKSIKNKIDRDRKKLETQITSKPDIPIYGTNRLHGDLKDKPVDQKFIEAYQRKYVQVHNCGTGKAIPEKVARSIIVIRLNSFAKGLSGIKLDTCQMMIDMLNKGVTPQILEEGSVGASGDLVPLSMMAATMIGLPEAKAYYKGELLSAPEALKKAKIKPVVLGAKEAMGLSNGANFIASWAAFAVRDIEHLLHQACLSTALSLEAIRGEQMPFSKLINERADRHSGQLYMSQQMRKILKGSKRTSIPAQTHDFGGESWTARVQDRYSFRCMPQVHGAAYEAWEKLKGSVEIEINAVSDNPLFDFDNIDKKTGIPFAGGGNFHGQALAVVIDYMKIALCSVGLMTDKRTFSMLDQRLSYGLPSNLAFLDPTDEISKTNGGLMITQYAGAARAAESRVLASPASVTSVSTSAAQEDFVSMGSIGVLHLTKVIENTQKLIGIELLCAHRALQLTKDWLPAKLQKLGAGTQKVHEFLSKKENLPKDKKAGDNFYLHDHFLQTDMDKAIAIVQSGKLLEL